MTDALSEAYREQIAGLLGASDIGEGERYYVPPLGAYALPYKDQEAMNAALFNVANSLLDPKSKVFQPGAGTYFNKLEL